MQMWEMPSGRSELEIPMLFQQDFTCEPTPLPLVYLDRS